MKNSHSSLTNQEIIFIGVDKKQLIPKWTKRMKKTAPINKLNSTWLNKKIFLAYAIY